MKYCPLCNREFPEGDVCDVDGATLIHAPMDAELRIGQVLKGSYRIEERLAAGGMGAVYRATQITLERQVAVKTLLPHLVSTASMVQRFFQEARLASQLSHPNVVSIFDFGNTEDGLFFMVMEYLEGQSLKDLVPESEGLAVEQALSLFEQVCSGVGAAHRRGLVHRDLKPDNVFVTGGQADAGRVKVLDFGIARSVEAGANTRLTQSGMLMGTPAFIAPEQIEESAAADKRSDIYALGAVLCFLLTGCKPYDGDTPPSILAKQLFDRPQIDPGISEKHPGLSAVVLRAMARDPDDRYQSIEELLTALNGAQRPGRAAREEVEETGRPAERAAGRDAVSITPGSTQALSDGGRAVDTARSNGIKPTAIAASIVVMVVLGVLGWVALRQTPGGLGTGQGRSE